MPKTEKMCWKPNPRAGNLQFVTATGWKWQSSLKYVPEINKMCWKQNVQAGQTDFGYTDNYKWKEKEQPQSETDFNGLYVIL